MTKDFKRALQLFYEGGKKFQTFVKCQEYTLGVIVRNSDVIT